MIVGGYNARATVRACLTTLTQQTAVVNAEIIFVDASTDGTADLVAAEFPAVVLLHGNRNSLVPHLWRLGLDAARGAIIAFTIAQCIPAKDWLSQILLAHRNGPAGVGGPIDGPTNGSGLDWALYFARYSAYLSPGTPGFVDEIPGDNAAYKRIALSRCQEEMREGFWETLVHVRLRANGEKLQWSPQMSVRLGAAGNLGATAALRFRHGRHYGATRPGGNSLLKRLARVAASPLIVPALTARILGRVRRQRPDWTVHFLRALPALIVLLNAWALGEISGYLSSRKNR